MQDAAGRLHDRLIEAYGPERVFMDIDSVPLGIDFVEHVTELQPSSGGLYNDCVP